MFAATSAFPVEVCGEAKGPFGGAFINPPALPAVAECEPHHLAGHEAAVVAVKAAREVAGDQGP